jgi:hypothetical protein
LGLKFIGKGKKYPYVGYRYLPEGALRGFLPEISNYHIFKGNSAKNLSGVYYVIEWFGSKNG